MTEEVHGVYSEHEDGVVWYHFPCGWTVKEVFLTHDGLDENGWQWRVPAGKLLFHCSDGIDSVTVTAESLSQAIWTLERNGMPPARLSKQNWHSGSQT